MRALLCPAGKDRRDFKLWKNFADGDAWRKNAGMQAAVCPDCGSPLIPDRDGTWLERGNNCLYSLETCARHGPSMVWLRRSHSDGLHYLFARATEKVDRNAGIKWENDKKAAVEYARRKQEKNKALQSGSGPKPNPRSFGARHS